MATTQPKDQTGVNLRVVPGTLTAATVKKLLDANPSRKYLLIQNTGTGGPMTIGTSSSVAAGFGIASLDAASGAGGQGGSWEQIDVVSRDEIWGISTAGTTYSAAEGN